ncbi:hypothetical protein ACFLYA_00295 [Candidatus Dependentiae bacterium]
MKKPILTLTFISCILLLANWSKEASDDVSGNRLHRIDFYGKIITAANQDKKPEITNISIDNIYKQIPVYIAPTTFAKGIDPKIRTITVEPKNILTQAKLDLSETKYLIVKRINEEPVIWEYKDESGRVKREYIEVEVVKNDNSKNNYLFEIRKDIIFNVDSGAGPEEQKINLKGLIKLEIDGYRDRELEKKPRFFGRKNKRRKQ